MDNYPNHLAPERDEAGAVTTPFENWWERVSHQFPNVPREVAQYWLHEHWGHSPYCWLCSSKYRFKKITFPSRNLSLIRTAWNDFEENHEACRRHGEDISSDWLVKTGYKTPSYIKENGNFPAPIIILDNRDDHLPKDQDPSGIDRKLPVAYVLIEGHRRFNIALYLEYTGQLKGDLDVWLMTHGHSS